MKIKKFMLVAMMLVFGVFMVACAKQDDGKTSDNSSKTETTSTDSKSNESAGGEIHVVSRENGSGTRGAFTEITKILEKGADGKEQDKTVSSAIVQNSTNAVMMTVGQDKDAIGYISLGSLNDKVNAVKINGVEATSENVQKGDYKISRPFNIAYKGELKPLPKDFLDYILSKEGQEIVKKEGYEQLPEEAKAYNKNSQKGKIVVAGSTSVSPLMEKLAESYKAMYPEVEIEIQSTGSSAGMNSAIEGVCDIGMASRELKDKEKEQLKAQPIAIDGIAVIVNKENTNATDLTLEQVKDIFTGKVKSWSEISK